MDPSKPAAKPSVGSAAGSLPKVAQSTTVQPKKSFEATLAERRRPAATTSNKPNLTREPSAVESVLTAVANAVDPNAQAEQQLGIVAENLAVMNMRTLLTGPQPGKVQLQREKSDAEEEGGA